MMCFSKLDHNLLKKFGGVEKNSFLNIVDPYPEESEENEEPVVINHSSYYEIHDMIEVLKKHKKQFSIFSTNIRSINSKIDELKIFIDRLHEHHVYFSAICIQEAWLKKGSDVSQLQIDGYKLISQGYSSITTDKGGLLIYLHEKFSHSPKFKLDNYHNWEGQIIQVKKGEHLAKPVIIGNIYRRPLELNENYKEFIDQFTPIIKKLESSNSDIALTGDFNIDLLDINNRQVVSEYFDMLTNCSLFPKITIPTRFDKHRATLIDNFFCKLTENTLNTTSGVLVNKFSDHQPYFTLIDNSICDHPSSKYITIHKNDDNSINNFKNELQEIIDMNPFDNNPSIDPNINYNQLHDMIQGTKEKHMPSLKVKFNKHKHKKNKWITKEIILLIQERDNLYKIHKMTDQNSEEYNTQINNLKSMNTNIKKSIRHAKKEYYSNLFNKLKSDIKGTWKIITSILNKTKNKSSFPSFFRDEDNRIITDKVQIANKFNSFFSTIGSKLARNIKNVDNKSFEEYLKKQINSKFKFHEVDEDSVNKIIDNLAPKTSFGFDGISTKLLKKIKITILKPITLIINQMLNTGVFPDKLKIAKINPIFKKDDETLFTNYRPISLLPVISKIFEKVMYQQVYNYSQEKKLFFNSQYGFRTGHSIDYAAIELIDRIILKMDKMDTPLGIFIDLSKAFDTLDHNILIAKLKYYGFDELALKLMESYLNNRQQYVQIDDVASEYCTVTTGVPQGSVLGPLLFIIYMNDIENVSKIFDFVLYADDTSLNTTLEIVIRESSAESLQNRINAEIENVNIWLKVNKLSLNIQKTKYMIFHMHNKKIPNFQIKIEDTIIERVSDFNFLGITINEHLSWKSHIDKVSNKMSRNIGILNRLKHFLPISTKTTIYNSLVLSHVNFGLVIWGFSCQRILKLQKKCVRIISLSKYNAHTDPIFKELKLLKVTDIYTLQLLKFYYKYKHQQLPNYLLNLPFNYNRDTHQYNTRTRNNLHTGRPAHEYAKKSIRFNLPIVINNTSRQIIDKIDTHSLKGFSGYVKQHTLSNYDDICTIQNCYVCGR